MKQSKITQAYKAIGKLYGQKLPLTISHKLWMLKQKLAPTWDFQIDKEQEMIMKFNPVFGENGQITFENDEVANQCRTEYNKLCNEMGEIEVDLGDYEKIAIKLDDKLELSIGDIDALSEFIDFTE